MCFLAMVFNPDNTTRYLALYSLDLEHTDCIGWTLQLYVSLLWESAISILVVRGCLEGKLGSLPSSLDAATTSVASCLCSFRLHQEVSKLT